MDRYHPKLWSSSHKLHEHHPNRSHDLLQTRLNILRTHLCSHNTREAANNQSCYFLVEFTQLISQDCDACAIDKRGSLSQDVIYSNL